MNRIACIALFAVATIMLSGCHGSRWARQDPLYSKKYDHHTDDPVRTVKQAVDARHVAGRDGNYFSVSGGSSHNVGEVSAGKFLYAPFSKGMVEGRIGLKGLVSVDHDGGAAGGIEMGARIQSPSRLAPFAGISLFAGAGPGDYLEAFTSDAVETDEDAYGAIGISPELGAHYWLTPQWRLTSSISQNYYRFEEAEHSIDYTTVGLSLSFLNIPNYREKHNHVPSKTNCADTISHQEQFEEASQIQPTTGDDDSGTTLPGLSGPYAALMNGGTD